MRGDRMEWAEVAARLVYAIRPHTAMAWRLDDYEASQRRWSG